MLTQPGQRYQLSFWLTNPTNGIPNEFRVAWNGTTIFDQVDMDAFAWTNMQFVVTATNTTSLLQFRFRNDQNAFGLDDVSVQPVPALMFQSVAQAGDAITFTWNAVPGLTYQVQYTDALNPIVWNNLGDAVTAASETSTATDAISSASQRWYRIVVLP